MYGIQLKEREWFSLQLYPLFCQQNNGNNFLFRYEKFTFAFDHVASHIDENYKVFFVHCFSLNIYFSSFIWTSMYGFMSSIVYFISLPGTIQ